MESENSTPYGYSSMGKFSSAVTHANTVTTFADPDSTQTDKATAVVHSVTDIANTNPFTAFAVNPGAAIYNGGKIATDWQQGNAIKSSDITEVGSNTIMTIAGAGALATATTLGAAMAAPVFIVGATAAATVSSVGTIIDTARDMTLDDFSFEMMGKVATEVGKDFQNLADQIGTSLGIRENINPNEIVITPHNNHDYTYISYQEVPSNHIITNNNDSFDLNDLSYKVNNGLYWNNENSESFQAIIQRDQEAAKLLQENEKLNQQWIAEQQSKEYFEWIPTEEVIIETPPVGSEYEPQSSSNIDTSSYDMSISYLDGYDTSFGSGYYQSKYDGLLPTINVDMTLPATDLNPWGNIDFNQYENFLGEPYVEKIDLSIPVDNFSGSLIGENSVDIDTTDFFSPDEIDDWNFELSGSLNDFADIDDGDFMTADSIDHWLDIFDDIPDTVVANTDDFGNIIGLVSDNPQSLFVDFNEPTSFNIYDDLADLTDNWDNATDSSISAVDHSIWNTSDWNTSAWVSDFSDSSLDSTSLLDTFDTDFGTAYWDNSFSNFDDGFDYGLTDYGYSLDSFDNFDYSFDSFDYGMDSFDSFDTFSTVDSFSYEPSIDFSPSFDFDFGGGSFW